MISTWVKIRHFCLGLTGTIERLIFSHNGAIFIPFRQKHSSQRHSHRKGATPNEKKTCLSAFSPAGFHHTALLHYSPFFRLSRGHKLSQVPPEAGKSKVRASCP
jgi:hypothetical protein